MPIKVQVNGAWQDVATGEFRIKNPSTTDWIYAANVKVCWKDSDAGAHYWVDSGYKGVPNAPTASNSAWSYTSMTVGWAGGASNGIPHSGFLITVKQEPSGPTRTFTAAADVRTQAFSVVKDTKYSVSVQTLGDTGVPSLPSNVIKPWIGHPKISTFADVTKWKAWKSAVKYLSSTPTDTAAYRNEIEGIYIHAGYRAEKIDLNLSGKYPWVPEDGYIINSSDRKAEWIVASAVYSTAAPRHVTKWDETVTLGPQTTAGTYGLRLIGAGWSTPGSGTPSTYTVVSGDSWYGIAAKLGCTAAELVAANPPKTLSTVIHPGDVLNVPGGGPPAALTGSMQAIGQESYVERVETVTTAEQLNQYW